MAELLRPADRRHPGRPARAARSSPGRITSIVRVPLVNLTIGMPLVPANLATACRKRVPICSGTAGEAIFIPRWPCKNVTTCPPT
jgi:hypothetical protein